MNSKNLSCMGLALGLSACTGLSSTGIGDGGLDGAASGGSSSGDAATETGGAGDGSGGGQSGGSGGGESSGGTSSTGGSGGAAPTGGWLHTEGNRILTEDGQPFHGRGANFFDTRSCDACTWGEPNPEGVKSWADVLIDQWHANFIRLNLWALPGSDGWRLQWENVVDDPSYYEDVQDIVNHMTSKPGVYVMVTLFLDPTMNPDGGFHATWPTEATLPVYEKIAEAFVDNPKVLFGLMNEPHDGEDQNAALADIFAQAIGTIRGVEEANGSPQHIIVAQGTQTWARDLSYWVENPLGENIAYETHAYNPPSDFEWLFIEPSQHIPVIIGEFGWSDYQTIEEAGMLMQAAEENDVPWIAWAFHQRCPPNLLVEPPDGYDGCGLDHEGTSFTFEPTEYGQVVKDRLAQPW